MDREENKESEIRVYVFKLIIIVIRKQFAVN